MHNRERLLFSSIIFFLVGCISWLLIRDRAGRIETHLVDPKQSSSAAQDFIDPGIASPSLTPKQVILRQVESLRSAQKDPDSLRICFGLASPGNRKQTGPFERFAELVSSQPYNSLGTAQNWQIGEVTMEGDFATALVTTIGSDGLPNAFRFSLQRQSENPFTNCWMTVAVEYVEVLPGLALSGR